MDPEKFFFLVAVIPLIVAYPIVSVMPVPQEQTQGSTRFVTYSATEIGNPVISPTGRQMAYLVSGDLNTQVALMNLDGRHIMQLSQGHGTALLPAFSPSGKFLAYVWRTSEDSQLVVVEIPTARSFVVSGSHKVGTFGWGYNSDKLVFDDTYTGDLVIWDDMESSLRVIHVGMQARYPTFGVSDNQVVFSGRMGEHYNLWSLEVQSGQLDRLTFSAADDEWPQMNPSRDEVLYVQTAENRTTYHIYDFGSGESRMVFRGPYPPPEFGPYMDPIPYVRPEIKPSAIPRWGPDGRHLLFLADSGNLTWRVYIASLDVEYQGQAGYTSGNFSIDAYRRIEQTKGVAVDANWGPDGTYVVVCSKDGSQWSLNLVQLSPGSIMPAYGYGTP